MPDFAGDTMIVVVVVENIAAIAVDISVEGSSVGLHSFLAC